MSSPFNIFSITQQRGKREQGVRLLTTFKDIVQQRGAVICHGVREKRIASLKAMSRVERGLIHKMVELRSLAAGKRREQRHPCAIIGYTLHSQRAAYPGTHITTVLRY